MNIYDGKQMRQMTPEEEQKWAKEREKIYSLERQLDPSKQREQAYNEERVIPWDGELLTVTEAAQRWQYYAAEGRTDKTDAITALISAAKASIRERWPD